MCDVWIWGCERLWARSNQTKKRASTATTQRSQSQGRTTNFSNRKLPPMLSPDEIVLGGPQHSAHTASGQIEKNDRVISMMIHKRNMRKSLWMRLSCGLILDMMTCWVVFVANQPNYRNELANLCYIYIVSQGAVTQQYTRPQTERVSNRICFSFVLCMHIGASDGLRMW